MADISQEIDNFKSAVYGEEVRDSMISLAEKVNSEVEKNTEDVNGAVQTANSASEAANKAVEDVQNTLTVANKAVEEAEKSATNAANSASASAEAAKEASESLEQSEAAAGAARESAERAEQIAEGLGGYDGTASSVSAVDTHDITGAGPEKKSTVQALLDVIAQKLVEKVVTSDTFQQVLAKYLVNNGLTTEAGKFGLDAAFGKNLQDQITEQNSNITNVIPNSTIEGFDYNGIVIPQGADGQKGPSIQIKKSGLYLCCMSLYMNTEATSGIAGIRFIRSSDGAVFQTLRLQHSSINGGGMESKTWVQRLEAGQNYGIAMYNRTDVDITLSGDVTVNYTSIFPLKLI